MTALTFGFANGSITVADDVAVPAGTGLVGELVTHADVNMPAHTNDVTRNRRWFRCKWFNITWRHDYCCNLCIRWWSR